MIDLILGVVSYLFASVMVIGVGMMMVLLLVRVVSFDTLTREQAAHELLCKRCAAPVREEPFVLSAVSASGDVVEIRVRRP